VKNTLQVVSIYPNLLEIKLQQQPKSQLPSLVDSNLDKSDQECS
jgi:hypothetical protein